jgi:hypothetical protein
MQLDFLRFVGGKLHVLGEGGAFEGRVWGPDSRVGMWRVPLPSAGQSVGE